MVLMTGKEKNRFVFLELETIYDFSFGKKKINLYIESNHI